MFGYVKSGTPMPFLGYGQENIRNFIECPISAHQGRVIKSFIFREKSIIFRARGDWQSSCKCVRGK
jgi:hypothetical protein